MTEPLFPGYPDPPDPYEGLGQDARRTARRRDRITRGIHPVAGTPILAGHTCGECAHLRLKHVHDGHWWKCDRLRTGSNDGPDMRRSWPACTAWEAKP